MSETTEINSVLNLLINDARITEAELARKINVPRATINRLVSGRTPDPRASTLNAIASYFNISVDQLIGKKPLLDSKQSIIETSHLSIPIIELEEAVNWERIISELNTTKKFDWIMVDSYSAYQGKFAIRVQGDSMWPQFQTDTILIISTDKPVKNRDFVIAYINKTKDVVFRQIITDGSYKFLKAINIIFPTINFENGDKIVGSVIQTIINYD